MTIDHGDAMTGGTIIVYNRPGQCPYQISKDEAERLEATELQDYPDPATRPRVRRFGGLYGSTLNFGCSVGGRWHDHTFVVDDVIAPPPTPL